MSLKSANGKRSGIGWVPVGIVGLTLGILGGTILFGMGRVRDSIEQQIISRDGEIFHALSLLQEPAAREDAELFAELDDPEFDWRMQLALKLSELRGVIAIRIHDAEGKFFQGIPKEIKRTDASPDDLAIVRANRPASRFAAKYSAAEIYGDASDTNLYPVLTVNIPLFDGEGANRTKFVGSAQFLVDGQSIADQFLELNRDMRTQASGIFVVAGGILVIGLVWALRRIGKHTEDLRAANNQLALAARTSALGAVTAHLIHGLRSPLSGLHNFVSGQSQDTQDVDWDSAVASTRRMQTLINEVISVLREEDAEAQYELDLGELLEMVEGRTSALATQLGTQLKIRRQADGNMDNRNANLVSLILVNLVQNALQATPSGGFVELLVERHADSFHLEVRDQGPGLPEQIRGNLFKPVSSTKEGGSGLGLAISNQLAGHLGAKLDLKDSGDTGTCFVLVAPMTVFTEKTRLHFSGGQ
jgi:signal transduction histidine kinase